MSRNRRPAHGWRVALLLAILGSVLLGAPTVATAAPATGADPAAVNATAKGSITFHKYLSEHRDSAARPATGAPTQPPAGAVPLAGVVYTVTRVQGVDLSTTAGWTQAAAYLDGGLPTARQNLGAAVTSAPTGPDGTTVVSGLPVGLYLVHEALGAKASADPNIVTAPDYLVTIPIEDPGAPGAWLYDLHVYPKSSHVTLTKSVADGNAGVEAEDAPVAGKVLTYTLDAGLPTDGLRAFGGRCERGGTVDRGIGLDEFGFTATGDCATGAVYVGLTAGAAYEVTDDLSATPVPSTSPSRPASDFFEFSGTDWTGKVVVTVSGSTGLTACTSAATDSCDYALVRTPSRVVVSLTDRGLRAAAAGKAANATATIRITMQARVRSAVPAATANGVLTVPNVAMLIPNGTAKRNGTSVPSNQVKTIFAALRLHKVSSADGSSLAGAVFTLYRTQADAQANRNPLAVAAATGADGLARFDGVHVADFQNNGPDNDSYWIVETTAPASYRGLTQPFAVRVNSDGTTEGADATGGVPVRNDKLAAGTDQPQVAGESQKRNVLETALAFTGANLPVLVGLGCGAVLVGLLLSRARRRSASAGDLGDDPELR
jgi:hypothetical protein